MWFLSSSWWLNHWNISPVSNISLYLSTDALDGNKAKNKYIEAISPPQVPIQPPLLWKRSKEDWERDKIELAELEYGKNALRHKDVPPYFDTSDGTFFCFIDLKKIALSENAIIIDRSKGSLLLEFM